MTISDSVKKVAEIAERFFEGKTQDDPVPLPELCRLLDSLTAEIVQDDGDGGLPQKDITTIRVLSSTENGEGLGPASFALETDRYRAILGLSLHLMLRMSKSEPKLAPTIAYLRRTIRRSKLILKILSAVYSISFFPSADVSLPSNLTVLPEWVEHQKQNLVEQEIEWDDQSSNSISLDREDLATEEDQLLHMAATPIPAESNWDRGELALDSQVLVARMSSSYLYGQNHQQSSVQIMMDCRGIIRLRDSSSNLDWWAALTAASATYYKSPNFTITSVLISGDKSTSRNDLALSTISLQVGRDGHKWWEATSVLIEKLKELQVFLDAISANWPASC